MSESHINRQSCDLETKVLGLESTWDQFLKGHSGAD